MLVPFYFKIFCILSLRFFNVVDTIYTIVSVRGYTIALCLDSFSLNEGLKLM